MLIDTKKSDSPSKESGAGTSKTIFLLIKSFLGSGIIFLPKAFYVAGLVPSLLLLSFSAIVSLWGLLLLGEAASVIPGSYQDIAFQLYGRPFRNMVLFSISIAQFSFSMIYILFIASNLKDLVSTLSNCQYQIHDFFWLIIAQLTMYIPLVMIRQMKNLAFVAIIGNISIFAGVIYILYINTTVAMEQPLEWKLFSEPKSTALFFGIAISAFEGIGLGPSYSFSHPS